MRMINTIRNWFGSNNTYNQTNIENQNNYSSKIKTLLKSLDGYFNNGDIVKAFELLNSAIGEYQHKESKYHLFLKKVEYLLEVRNIDEAKKTLDLLKKDYNNYINTKYKELLLSIHSIEQREKEFFLLLEEIKLEKGDVKSDKYFNIFYNLNSANLDKAKKEFEEYTFDEKEKNYILGGHLYANLYRETHSEESLELATKYYKTTLDNNPDFLLKLQVEGFFITNIINEVFQTQKEFDKKKLIEYKKSLKKLFQERKFFNKYYINSQKVFYASMLILLDFQDEFIQFYEDNETVLFDEYYLQYCSEKEIKIDHLKIQSKFDKNDSLLVSYGSLMTNKDEQTIILEFFEKKLDLLFKNDLILLFYIKGITTLKKYIPKDVKDYIISNKSNSHEIYMAYLLLKNYLGKEIKDNEIELLLNFTEKENTVYAKILETIDLLKKIRKQPFYIKLAISKIKQFKELTPYILNKCWHDQELMINDFELLIENIDKLAFSSKIADIYLKYNRYDKSFEYFALTWNNEKTINNAINLLIVSFKNYESFVCRIDEEIEDEAIYYLNSMHKELSFNNISLISYFSLVIRKDINNAFGVVNKKILGIDVSQLDNFNKQQLSSLYFGSIINFKDKEFGNFEKNTIFLKEGIYYLDKELFKNIHKVYVEKFNIVLTEKMIIKRFKDDKSYEEKSLFHFILNKILHTIEEPSFITMKVNTSANNPFESLQEQLIEQSKHTEDIFEKFSNNEDISFWSMTGTYDKYFELISELLNNEKINFKSCQINFKDKSVPKLLTLSSIVFLNYNNKLENVLKREDVFIQKTTYDWLSTYIEKLSKEDEIFSVFVKDGQCYKNIVSKEQIEIFTNRLKEILNNINLSKIIDDIKYSLPFKEAFELSKYYGIQEYQALAISYKDNYQIITEDRIFEVIYDGFRFNKSMISNSLSLLEIEEINELGLKLHKKKYKYVINENLLTHLIRIITKQNIVNDFSYEEIELIKILNDYGWLDSIKKYYIHNYKILYPKINIPEKDFLSNNIEYLLDFLDDK